jgi:hypothetical protein
MAERAAVCLHREAAEHGMGLNSVAVIRSAEKRRDKG